MHRRCCGAAVLLAGCTSSAATNPSAGGDKAPQATATRTSRTSASLRCFASPSFDKAMGSAEMTHDPKIDDVGKQAGQV